MTLDEPLQRLLVGGYDDLGRGLLCCPVLGSYTAVLQTAPPPVISLRLPPMYV